MLHHIGSGHFINLNSLNPNQNISENQALLSKATNKCRIILAAGRFINLNSLNPNFCDRKLQLGLCPSRQFLLTTAFHLVSRVSDERLKKGSWRYFLGGIRLANEKAKSLNMSEPSTVIVRYFLNCIFIPLHSWYSNNSLVNFYP